MLKEDSKDRERSVPELGSAETKGNLEKGAVDARGTDSKEHKPANSESATSSRKWALMFLALLLATSIGTGAYFGYQYYQQKQLEKAAFDILLEHRTIMLTVVKLDETMSISDLYEECDRAVSKLQDLIDRVGLMTSIKVELRNSLIDLLRASKSVARSTEMLARRRLSAMVNLEMSLDALSAYYQTKYYIDYLSDKTKLISAKRELDKEFAGALRLETNLFIKLGNDSDEWANLKIYHEHRNNKLSDTLGEI